jgi:DNA-binding MarR family transcriptional regulator
VNDDLAAQAWTGMRALVLDNDRRKAVSTALGMSFLRAKALRAVAATAMTMRELTASLVIDAPYTTVVVDDLEKRGLVVRTPHPTDRRVKVVSITPAGAALARQADAILDEPPAALRALPPAELAALARTVGVLLGAPAIPTDPALD